MSASKKKELSNSRKAQIDIKQSWGSKEPYSDMTNPSRFTFLVARSPMVLTTASTFTSAPVSDSVFSIFDMVCVCIMKLEIGKSNTPGEL